MSLASKWRTQERNYHQFTLSPWDTSSGIATVSFRDMVVEGWNDDIIGMNLQPCHPGVLTFSPRDSH